MAFIPTVDKLEIRAEILLDVEGFYHFSVVTNTSEGQLFSQNTVFSDHAFAHAQGHLNGALTIGLNSLAKQLRTHRKEST